MENPDYQEFDNEASLREAKSRLPLDRLMEQHGDTPPPVGKKWGACPFCKKKSTARITDDGQQKFFKCANDTCPSETASEGRAWTELHYLGYKTGFAKKDVFIAYLKEAGVWKEKERYKPSDVGTDEDEEIIQQCIEVVRNEQSGSISLLQRRLRLGYTRAARIMDELEKRGIVGPSKGTEPRDILIDGAPQAAAGQSTQDVERMEPSHVQPVESGAGSTPAGAAPADPAADEAVIAKATEIVRAEKKATIGLLKDRLSMGHAKAERVMAELEKRGIVGKPNGNFPREVITSVPKSELQKLEDDIQNWVDYLKRAEKRTFHFLDLENQFGFDRAKVVYQAIKDREVARPLGKDGELELIIVPAPTVEFISSKPPGNSAAPPSKIDGEEGYAALHDFFLQLALSAADEELIFKRRGLKSSMSAALRFRSNPRTNRGRLLGMLNRFSRQELLDSGLFVRVKNKSGEIKPNSQFCGAGIIRKAKPGEKPARNEWMDKDGNIWGWCQPILIPYFDEMGRLIGLRPHKGGAPANTAAGVPHIYVPRGPRDGNKPTQESFSTAVITEGEFKAAALYQTVGAARVDGKEPYGVAAVPGIWFGQNYSIREELDQWLRDVRCSLVKVAYDNEEKGNPELESFKTDRQKRFDAEICARVLATDIANKLHIRGEVCRLPNEWRNTKGKADWDGALVELTQPKERK